MQRTNQLRLDGGCGRGTPPESALSGLARRFPDGSLARLRAALLAPRSTGAPGAVRACDAATGLQTVFCGCASTDPPSCAAR